MARIILEVTTEPAHILGKRHSTHARVGSLKSTADTKAGALYELELDVVAKLRYPTPDYRGGKVTRRIYAMTCQGQAGMSNGQVCYSWMVDILDPQNGTYPSVSGYGFSSATHSEALNRLEEYVASCEAAYTPTTKEV